MKAEEEGKQPEESSEAKAGELQKEYECLAMMDEFLENLKILDYEKKFCKQKFLIF